MRKVLAALGLLGGLWASNVTATIVSYNVTVAGGDWRITDPTPFGIASEPTFSGTLQVNNAYSDGTALVGFKMVTGSKTWTEKSLASANNASFSFDSVGNLSNFGISFATGISANLYISPSLFLLQEPVSNPPNPTKPVASAICDGCVSFAPTSPPPQPPYAITSNMLLASVAGATPSAGTALGDSIKYYRDDVYRSQQAAIEDCVFNNKPPGCDAAKLYSQQQQGYAKFAGDVATVGVEVNNSLQGKAVGSVAVDTSVWNGTLLAKVKSFADFVGDVKSYLQNGIDLYKSLFSTPSAQSGPAALIRATDPILINSITGNMYWDDDGNTSWLLSDLRLSVDIAKDYFPDIATGQLFATLGSLYPGSTGFGVFTVNDIVDPPGYNTVSLSFRHIDYFASGLTVPEPGSAALLAIGLVGLAATRRRKKQ